MKRNESCQCRSYVAQAELINHKTFLKYQPDSLPHPKLNFSFLYESAHAIFKTKTGKRTGGRGQNGKEMGKDWFFIRYRKDNKIRDWKKMTALQKEVRLWQIALSRAKKSQGFFSEQRFKYRSGWTAEQSHCPHFPASVFLQTGDFAGVEWRIFKICPVAESKIKLNQDAGVLNTFLCSKPRLLKALRNTSNFSRPC